MSETIDLELKRAFPNYVVFIKYNDYEKQKNSRKFLEPKYIVYKKDAFICSYFLKTNTEMKKCSVAKVQSKLKFGRGQKEEINVLSLAFSYKNYSKIVNRLKKLSVNYICVNKTENYYEIERIEFKDNAYYNIYNKVKKIAKNSVHK